VPITGQKSPVSSIVSLPTDSVIVDHAVEIKTISARISNTNTVRFQINSNKQLRNRSNKNRTLRNYRNF
jgi:hypothetical protein